MAQGAPSPADLQVVRELASRKVVVTASQLESWRRAGLLPRHRRRGLGRGRGSVVDVVDPVVVESAAALARHGRQGRDRRLAVLEWFAEAGMAVRPGAAPVPEPPVGAVRQALVWVLERSVSQRLVEFARGAAGAGEEGQDALYAAADRLMKRYRGAANPALVRAALEASEDVPVDAEGPDSRSMVHLVAAIGFGAQEIGADALAEGLAALGMFGITVEDWAQALGAAERGEVPPVDWGPVQREAGLVDRVKRASDEELVRARTVLVGLRWFYGLYALHGLLLPDNPALTALRQQIDEWGMFPVLSRLIAFSPSPGQFAEALTVCLEPLLDALYETLTDQLADGPNIFPIPGDESGTGVVGFGESWLRTLREQSGGNESGEASVRG